MSAVWAKSLGVDEFGDETAHGLGVTPWMGGPWSLASLAYSDSASSELSISSLDIEDSSSRSSSTACTRGLREVARTSFRSLGCPMMVSAGILPPGLAQVRSWRATCRMSDSRKVDDLDATTFSSVCQNSAEA